MEMDNFTTFDKKKDWSRPFTKRFIADATPHPRPSPTAPRSDVIDNTRREARDETANCVYVPLYQVRFLNLP